MEEMETTSNYKSMFDEPKFKPKENEEETRK